MFVKICGITNEDDALVSVAMGADAIGFVMAPSSRQIAPVRAGDIAKRIPTSVLTVGVFRNESRDQVVRIVNRQGLGAAQLHGWESAEDTMWIAERVPRVIKAFEAGSDEARRANEWGTNPILIDAVTPGSGETWDWSLASETPDGLSVLIAGGLRPSNVAQAVEQVKPWGVDVSSGVERSPGHKDALAVRDFVANARAAAAEFEAAAVADMALGLGISAGDEGDCLS